MSEGHDVSVTKRAAFEQLLALTKLKVKLQQKLFISAYSTLKIEDFLNVPFNNLNDNERESCFPQDTGQTEEVPAVKGGTTGFPPFFFFL